ncbi:hypothetical protein HPB51_004720 [Rhipicephalus microplus]|uniref:POLQ-like helical domain-containing protein n=1 Tax=Rhipicephalus microplus TaxID=6941 RepID=A0A9J6E037_RHIMP|nr:hypothetical protein HPB51_004720 [Rhipicephalus microplus]
MSLTPADPAAANHCCEARLRRRYEGRLEISPLQPLFRKTAMPTRSRRRHCFEHRQEGHQPFGSVGFSAHNCFCAELIDERTRRRSELLTAPPGTVRNNAGEDGDLRYCPSQLGRAALASGLSPDDALGMVAELERARRCLALDSDLHLVYLVTPGHLGAQLGSLDWGRYQRLWERLSAAQRRVAGLVGVDEACVARAAAGRAPPPGRLLDGCRRFYLALALELLASERPLAEVARIFACPRGLLQSLQQGAATFAGTLFTLQSITSRCIRTSVQCLADCLSIMEA